MQGLWFALAERPTAGSEDDVVDAARPGASVFGQALEDRRVFAVDGQQRGAAIPHGLHEERAPYHERFFVGQQQSLAGARGRHAGR